MPNDESRHRQQLVIERPLGMLQASPDVLRRLTTPDDIAQVIVSLIAGADLVTGQTVVVDGGSR